jgi:hypothetical protein
LSHQKRGRDVGVTVNISVGWELASGMGFLGGVPVDASDVGPSTDGIDGHTESASRFGKGCLAGVKFAKLRDALGDTLGGVFGDRSAQDEGLAFDLDGGDHSVVSVGHGVRERSFTLACHQVVNPLPEPSDDRHGEGIASAFILRAVRAEFGWLALPRYLRVVVGKALKA